MDRKNVALVILKYGFYVYFDLSMITLDQRNKYHTQTAYNAQNMCIRRDRGQI